MNRVSSRYRRWAATCTISGYGVDQRDHEDAERGHAGLDRQVLGFDHQREVGGMQLDERLDEGVLVMMMKFEQRDQFGALLGHVGDPIEVGDVEGARVHRGVEHHVADGLVDLLVQVVGQRRVGELDGVTRGFVDGSGLESCHGGHLEDVPAPVLLSVP